MTRRSLLALVPAVASAKAADVSGKNKPAPFVGVRFKYVCPDCEYLHLVTWKLEEYSEALAKGKEYIMTLLKELRGTLMVEEWPDCARCGASASGRKIERKYFVTGEFAGRKVYFEADNATIWARHE